MYNRYWKNNACYENGYILHAHGVLASDRFMNTTASDYIGDFVGQSKMLMENKLEEARGGVLFIDESYLLGESPYGNEALATLSTLLNQSDYNESKTIVILAGNPQQMEEMLSQNSELVSRFTERIHFDNWTSNQCVRFIKNKSVSETIPINFDNNVELIVQHGLAILSTRPDWSNIREALSLFAHLKQSRTLRIDKDLKDSQISDDLSFVESDFLDISQYITLISMIPIILFCV